MAMAINNPFNQDSLNNIFKVSPQDPDRVNSRESSWLEFKEKFSFGSLAKYAKTMAAFANSQGGYIVFGIKDKPHKMVGIKEKDFNSIDPAKLTGELNKIFSPEIQWELNIHNFEGKSFGIIYTYQSINKPIIATKSSGDIKEAEIYYRYRGRSEKIKYSEFIQILEERRVKEQKIWMQHLERISRIGVEDAAIFDLNTGKATGASGSFLIDEDLLPKLNFVKEGQFIEKEGSPIFKLMGDLKSISKDSILPTKKVYTTKTKGIRTDDIVNEFLNQTKVDNPIEYVKQICWETSANLPVYYYISQADKPISETISILEEVKSRSPAKKRLIQRLKNPKTFKVNIPNTSSRAAQSKKHFHELIKNKKINIKELPDDFRELRYLIQSIRTLDTKDMSKTYVFKLLKQLYESYYTRKDYDLSGEIRSSVCYVDVLFFLPKIKTKGETNA